jgi:hypothetical protein
MRRSARSSSANGVRAGKPLMRIAAANAVGALARIESLDSRLFSLRQARLDPVPAQLSGFGAEQQAPLSLIQVRAPPWTSTRAPKVP